MAVVRKFTFDNDFDAPKAPAKAEVVVEAPPPPPTFSGGWQLGTPDLILEAGSTFSLPAAALMVAAGMFPECGTTAVP